ncbi:MAG: serine/threonine-protein kinase [Pirellulaceae bacterium]
MQTQARNKVESIFFQAIQAASGAKRDAFLDNACGGDSALRQEVELLIAAHQAPDSFLQAPVDALTATPDFDVLEREGSTIGRYKLLEKLGEGGFGLVFMAEQTSPVRRRVALKIIKPGMDSKEVVARFEAERQALAMMDHPNIAKVLDAGTTETGRPYFVMELVKGASITEYCDANRLGTRGRLELFQQVCRAIQHAHQKGVIHRDLKPNNVMVTLHDGVPVPKVIDFGVSKALSQPLTEKTLFTRYGQIVGTPQYMSPEQAEMSGLDVDTRSDVYSLGVLLYELLTGQPPFDADTLREAGFDGMRRIIREQEPIKPSTVLSTLKNNAATLVAGKRSLQPHALRQSVAGDLDWIVMKSLEKDRNRRYETASDLSRDIDRHLANEPIKASPPSFVYQLKKLYQRNRVAVGTFAAIASSLLIGIVFTTIAWANENQQRQIADEQREVADQQRVIAQENAAQLKQQVVIAEQAAKRAQSTLDVLESLLTKAGPDPEKGTEVKVSDLLSKFAADLNSVELEDRRVEIEIRMTLAKAFARFAMSEEEGQQYQIAEKVARDTYPPKSLELASFLHRRATSWNVNAVPCLEEALTCLDDTSASKLLQIDIYRHLGFKLAWDKAVSARTKLEKACELTRGLTDVEKSRLESNPFQDLAGHLEYFHNDLAGAKELANEAVAYGKQFGNVEDQIAAILLSRKLENGERRDQLVNEARGLAINAANGDYLVKVLESEVDDMWAKGVVPGFEAKANRMADEVIAHWPLIHDKNAVCVGHIWGMQLQLRADQRASEIEALIKKLPKRTQQDCADEAAQRLRMAGKLREASDLYDQAYPDEPWNPTVKARSRSAARNFSAAIPLLERGVELSPKHGTTTRLWIRFELATILEAAGKPAEAKAVYEMLIPELLEAQKHDTHSVALLVHALAKSGNWNAVESGSLETMSSQIKRLVKGDERYIFNVLYTTALALIQEHRGDKGEYIDLLVKANQFRPGTFESFDCEWIPELLVQRLTDSGDIVRLEQILRDDVRHRDESLPEYHPERAFTRIRLAEMLLRQQRSTSDIQPMLIEAEKVYAYHGDWIPQKEHETLASLMQKASEFSSTAKEER